MIEKVIESLPSPIYSIRSLSLFHEVGIVNLSGYDIWISDSSKNVYLVENRSLRIDGDQFITIYSRTDPNASKRKFNYGGVEVPNGDGFKVTKYSININYLLSKGHIYIEDLGICIAFNRQDAEAYNISSPVYQAKHHQNLLEMYKTAMTMSPFKVMCNDPYFKLNELWTIINNKAFAIDITHIKDEPEQCKIYLGIKPGDYSVTDIKFESLVKGEYIFDCDGTEVMLFPTRDMALKQIYKNKSNSNVFSFDDLQRKVKEAKTTFQLDIDKYKKSNIELKNQNEILHQENIILRQQIDNNINNHYKEHINNMALKREQYKTEKERMSYKSTEYSNWVTIAKSVATILPVLVSIYGFIFMKKNS